MYDKRNLVSKKTLDTPSQFPEPAEDRTTYTRGPGKGSPVSVDLGDRGLQADWVERGGRGGGGLAQRLGENFVALVQRDILRIQGPC